MNTQVILISETLKYYNNTSHALSDEHSGDLH